MIFAQGKDPYTEMKHQDLIIQRARRELEGARSIALGPGLPSVLSEVAPGVSTDDVKKQTATSLHIADGIRLMDL